MISFWCRLLHPKRNSLFKENFYFIVCHICKYSLRIGVIYYFAPPLCFPLFLSKRLTDTNLLSSGSLLPNFFSFCTKCSPLPLTPYCVWSDNYFQLPQLVHGKACGPCKLGTGNLGGIAGKHRVLQIQRTRL